MAVLTWNAVGNRFFETGLDRGVLYPPFGSGVVWNGLLSVDVDPSRQAPEALYYDGKKYLDFVAPSEFAATLSAFTYPDEFLPLDGVYQASTGLYLDNQMPQTFGLSYRTRIGNDIMDIDLGYKLHVLYDLTATPSSQSYAAISDETEPLEFSWQLSSRPQSVAGYRPTSHVILDSRKMSPATLAILESILYGSSTSSARLPSINEIMTLNASTLTIIINDNGDGTWTAVGPDSLITMLDANTFQIIQANAVYLDADTYQISSS